MIVFSINIIDCDFIIVFWMKIFGYYDDILCNIVVFIVISIDGNLFFLLLLR